MTDRRRALLVFTRSPEAESRAKGLEPERAAALFTAFLASWKSAAEDAGAVLLVSSPPECSAALQRISAIRGATFLRQSPGRFARRLGAAAESAFALGFSTLAVVPGDTPAIAGEELSRVFGALEEPGGRVVLGPARDGGISLLGLTSAQPELLSGISQRDPRACERLAARLERVRVTALILDPRDEVDSPADVRRLHRSSASCLVWNRFRTLLAAACERDASPRPGRVFLPGALGRSSLPARAPPVFV